MFQRLLLSIVFFLVLAEPSLAQINVVEVDSVAALHALPTPYDPATTSIHLASYYCSTPHCQPDGGEGLLVGEPNPLVKCHISGIGPGTLEDGGSVFADTANHCWYRQNLNGDLRQWGLTAKSDYDAIYVLQNPMLGLTLQNATDTIRKAITALGKIGITQLHTRQVNLKIGLGSPPFNTPLQIPAGGSLSCDAVPVRAPQNGDFTRLPGSLIIAHSDTAKNYIDATNNDAEVANCAAIIPEWYIDPTVAAAGWDCSWNPPGDHTHCGVPVRSQNSDPVTFDYTDLDAIRANMASAGDYAIKAGDSAKIHDLTIAGFDNCLWVDSAPGLYINKVGFDCPIGLYVSKNNGSNTIENLDNNPFLTKHTKADTELYWDIRDVEPGPLNASGDPICRITIRQAQYDQEGKAGPSLDIFGTTGSFISSLMTPRGDPYRYPMWITGLPNVGASCSSGSTGPHQNDAAWAFTVVDKGTDGDGQPIIRLDLIESDFACPAIDGDTCPRTITTQGDWSANTGIVRLSGSIANIIPGMNIKSDDTGWPHTCAPSGTSACALTVTGVVPRATGPDPADGYNGYVIVSPPPPSASTGSTPGFVPVNITFSNPPSHDPDHPNQYADDDPCAFTGGGDFDSGKPSGNCVIFHAAPRYIAGASPAGLTSARMPASRGGMFGAGYLLDRVSGLRGINTFTFAHYYNVATIDNPTCNFVQPKGDAITEAQTGNSVAISLAGASRGCSFTAGGSGIKPGAAIVNDLYSTTETLSDKISIPVSQVGLHAFDLGTITLSAALPSSWPSIGVIHICSSTDDAGACKSGLGGGPVVDEYVNYSGTPGTPGPINVLARARFGTAPVDWSMQSSGVTLFLTQIGSGAKDNPGKSSATVFSGIDNPAGSGPSNQFEILHGGAIFTNVHAAVPGNAFVSTNATGVSVTGSDETQTSIYFEDENARKQTTISSDSQFANFANQGALNLPLSYYQWFGSPQGIYNLTGGDISSGQVGNVSVQDTSNWPQTGILRIESEYAAFHIVDGVTISLDQRGVCGSTAAAHSAFNTASYQNVLFGCPAGTGPLPQFALDSTGQISSQQSGLAHGQVYMSFDGSNIELCPHNGSGLMIAGTLRQVHGCAWLPEASAASGFQYIYATYHQIPVSDIDNNSSHLRLTVPSTAGYAANSALTCYGITGSGAAQINGATQTSTSVTATSITLLATSSVSMPPPHGTGACEYVGLEFSTTAYALDSKGVEVMSGVGNSSKTLVGAVYAASAGTIVDDSSHRDVASWFNRKGKTCVTAWPSDGEWVGGSFGELKTSLTTPLHCQFIAWDQDIVDWSLFGMVNDSAPAEVASAAAGFDGAAPTTERVQFRETANGQRYPLGLSGRASFSGDNVHYITMLGTSSASSSVTVYATGGESVRIPQ